MNPNSFWSHVEHTAAGVVLTAAPLLLAGIPTSWQEMTVGGLLGLAWSIVRGYLITVTAD
jgi:hypothetical protein